MSRSLICLLTLLSFCLPAAVGQQKDNNPDYPPVNPESVKAFQRDRFGMFIHWGPVSLKGVEIGWSRGCDRFDRKTVGCANTQEYDNLYKNFNPVKFDAEQWVQIALDAGMKYMVFTTKHHDGFCMFDTGEHDFKITSEASPFGRDIVDELSKACQKKGLKFAPYYSIADWWYVDQYEDYEKSYQHYIHNQIFELCSKYGQIQALWFDAGPNCPPIDTVKLFKMIRTLQPDALINDRTLVLPGDYDTPEQKIGRFQTNRPWESCMTLGDGWAWNPNDRIKSLKECIYILVHTFAGGGNLLLNVGPMPDGRIEPRQVERLREIGQWLRQYGHTVLECQAGPFKSNPWCASAYKDNIIYLHLTRIRGGLPIVLPGLPLKIRHCTLLTGEKIRFEQSDKSVILQIEASEFDPIDTIVKMELNGFAKDISPIDIIHGPLTFVSAKASGMHERDMFWGDQILYGTYPPERAIDDNYYTIWMAKGQDRTAWFESDLGQSCTIDRLLLKETHRSIEEFTVLYKTDPKEEWKPLFSDTVMGDDYLKTFKPTSVRLLRIEIAKANGQIGLRQIHPYSPVVE